MVIEGNHEVETDAKGRSFQAYGSRYRVPYAESGSPSNLYYSFDLPGAVSSLFGRLTKPCSLAPFLESVYLVKTALFL